MILIWLFSVVIYFVFTFMIAEMGRSRELGCVPALLICLLLSPVVGLICVLVSRRKVEASDTSYYTNTQTYAGKETVANDAKSSAVANKLSELKKMKDAGVLSDTEYNAAKDRIMNEFYKSID